MFWEGGVDSERVAHIHFFKRGVYSGRRGRFWEGRRYNFLNRGYILGGRRGFWESRTYKLFKKGGIFWEGYEMNPALGHLCVQAWLRIVRWVRWHCPWDTGFEIHTLEVCDRSRRLPTILSFLRVGGEETLLFLWNRRDRETNPGLYSVKGSGANHYPRAPALFWEGGVDSGIRRHFSKSREGGNRSWEVEVDSGSPRDLPRGTI